MGKTLKYMGTADIRKIPKGTNFGGQLAEPTEKEVVFSAENYWVVDAAEAGLSDEAVALLLEDKDAFKDVSDLKRIPANAHQSTFLGMKSVSEEEAAAVSTADSTVSDTGTTTGGSTAGTDVGDSSKAGKSGKST